MNYERKDLSVGKMVVVYLGTNCLIFIGLSIILGIVCFDLFTEETYQVFDLIGDTYTLMRNPQVKDEDTDKVGVVERLGVTYLYEEDTQKVKDLSSNMESVIGDVVECVGFDLQVTNCYAFTGSNGESNYAVEFIVSNWAIPNGLDVTSLVKVNTLNQLGVDGMLEFTLEDNNTLLNRGTSKLFLGQLEVAEGDRPFSLTVLDGDTYKVISLNHKLDTFERLETYFSPYINEGTFNASLGDTINLDGVEIKIKDKLYRYEKSTYHNKPFGDNENVAIRLKIKNKTEESLVLSNRYRFVLVDSLGNMYKEVVYYDVENLVNNSLWQDKLEVGKSCEMYVDFHAPQDINKLLIIQEDEVMAVIDIN